MCWVGILLSFFVIEILWTAVTPWSFRFSSISDSGTYIRSGSEMTPLLLFKVLCVLIVTGMFPSKVHFFSFMACKLFCNSIRSSPVHNFLIYLGSPTTDWIAFCICLWRKLVDSWHKQDFAPTAWKCGKEEKKKAVGMEWQARFLPPNCNFL